VAGGGGLSPLIPLPVAALHPNGRHLRLFEKYKVAGFSPCGSQVVHQISKTSVERFKSYRYYKKNPRWPPACGRHLAFLENLKDAVYTPCGSEVVRQILKRSVKRFKRYHDYKNPRWPRPTAAILDFLKIFKLQVLALVGPKWHTKFQKDRSSSLNVIAITKI
jgi:hypothetical protein